MLLHVRGFTADESGAVTVDWVVLSAALVGMGVATLSAVSTGTGALSDGIRATLSNASFESMSFGAAQPASFVYSLLSLSEANANHFIQFYSQHNSDAQVQNWYNMRIQDALNQMASGQNAAQTIDYVYVFEQALINRGVAPVSQSGHTLQDLLARHQAG